MSRSRACLAVVLALLPVVPFASPVLDAQRRPPGAIRIVLLVDSSHAMASMLTHFRAGLNAFLDALHGNPEIAFISTGGQIRIRTPPTSDRDVLRKAISVFASDGGGNSFLDTMIEADRRFLKVAPDKRSVFVMLMTDNGAYRGEPRLDQYNRFMNQFVDRGGRAHVVIVGNTATGVTTRVLRNLTGNTNGFYDVVAIPNPLPARMKSLAEFVALDQL